MDFTTWTKADFIAFDARRQEVFQPTPEELEQQRVEQEAQIHDIVTEKLARIGVQLTEPITKEFVFALLDTINAKQFIGENVEQWVDNQIELFDGDINKAFRQLVLQYL